MAWCYCDILWWEIRNVLPAIGQETIRGYSIGFECTLIYGGSVISLCIKDLREIER